MHKKPKNPISLLNDGKNVMGLDDAGQDPAQMVSMVVRKRKLEEPTPAPTRTRARVVPAIEARTLIDSLELYKGTIFRLKAPTTPHQQVMRAFQAPTTPHQQVMRAFQAPTTPHQQLMRAFQAPTPSKAPTLSADEFRRRIKEREQQLETILNVIKQRENVDLCFVVDCTGSMGRWIDAVKKNVQSIITSVQQFHKRAIFKVAFVRYTDFDVIPFPTTFQDFTSDISAFVRFAEAIKPSGGGDAPEDVMSGLEVALFQLSWRPKSTRILVHIADAPAHGKRFNSLADNYPQGDPRGRTDLQMMTELVKKEISYFFGFIQKNQTDKMIQAFNRTLKRVSAEAGISQFDIADPAQIHKCVVTLTTESLQKSFVLATRPVSGTSRGDIVDTSQPNFLDSSKVQRKSLFLHENQLPATVDQIIGESWGLTFCPQKSLELVICKIPFAQGGVRVAYHAIDPKSQQRLVYKLNKSLDPSANIAKRYLVDLETQTIATFFALEFNKALESSGGATRWRMKVLKSLVASCGEQHASLEAFVGDKPYVKLNTNTGSVCEHPRSEFGQAFSHFSWKHSRGNHLVVDVQGFVDEANKCFQLTDPAIHSKNVLKFGGTNLGRQGMERFFASHVCGSTCRTLKMSTVRL